MVCKNANSQAFVFNNILVTLYWFNSCYQYNLEIYGPLSQNMVESAILDCIYSEALIVFNARIVLA